MQIDTSIVILWTDRYDHCHCFLQIPGVIPLAVRQRLKLAPGAKLMVVEFNGGLRLVPLKQPSALRGIARGVATDIEREPDRPI